LANDLNRREKYQKLLRLRELKQMREKRKETGSDFSYISKPVKPEEEEETIYNPRNGETFKTPVGSGRMMRDIYEDKTFNTDPTTIPEQIGANAQKVAANTTLLLAANDIIADDQASEYIAKNARSWQNAQRRQPEEIKAFHEAWQERGIFGKAASIFQYPQAIGREIVTQVPNQVLPLFASLAGAKATGLASATIGTALAGPGGGAVGGAIGAVGGGLETAYQANKLMGAAETLDQIAVEEYSVNPGDAESVLNFLSDEEKVEGALSRAQEAGANMAKAELLTQFMTLGLAKWTKGMSLKGKIAGGAGSTVLEAGGETIGEAERQRAAFKDVDWDDALLEGVIGLGSSAAQTGINYSIVGTKYGAGVLNEKLKDSVFKNREDTNTSASDASTMSTEDIETIVDNIQQAETQAETQTTDTQAETKATETEIRQQPTEEKKKTDREEAVTAIMDAKQKAPEVLGEVLQKEHKNLESLKQELLDERIKDLEKQSKKLKERIEKTDSTGGREVLRQDLKKVSDELDRLIVDQEEMVKGKKVESAAKVIQRQKDNIKKIRSSFKEGQAAAKADIKSTQSAMIEIIKDSELDSESRGRFLTDIKNLKNPEDLVKKIEKIADQNTRKATIKSIQDTVKKAKKTKTIAADYIRVIEDVVSDIDFKRRSDETLKRLNQTKDYWMRSPDNTLPSSVLKDLETLTKKPVDQVATDELVSMAENVKELYKQGRTKQKLKEKARVRRQEKRINSIKSQAETRAFTNETKIVEGLNKELTGFQRMQNFYTQLKNRANEIQKTTNVADIYYDMHDGGKNYKGAVYQTFKAPVDQSHNNYLDTRIGLQQPIKNLAKELDLSAHQYKRIGVYATAQQAGGREKLIGSGLSENEIDSLVLSEDETKMYNAMREILNKLYPRLSQTMLDVYNEDVGFVKNYFPFLTDFESMTGMEIKEMFREAVPGNVKRKNVKRGFTKDRTGGDQKVRLNAFDVFMHHTDNAAYLIEMGQTIKELQETVKTVEMEDALGDLGTQTISEWLDLLARKGRHATASKGMDMMRGNVSAAILGLKLSTTFLQATAFVDGAAHIGPDYVSRGTQTFATSPEWRQFVFDNMPEIRERMGDDPAFLNFGDKGIMSRYRQFGYTPMQVVDGWAATSVAIGAYMRAVEREGGTVSIDTVNENALVEAQLMVRRSQSSPFAKDAALVASLGKLTGDNWSQSWDAWIFQFQSFMMNRWGTIKHDFPQQIRDGNIKESVNTAIFMSMAQLSELGLRWGYKFGLPYMLYALTGAEWLKPEEEDEDEGTFEKLRKQSMSTIPYISQTMSALDYGSNPVPALSVFESVAEKANWAKESKDSTKQMKHTASAVLMGLGLWTGAPGTYQLDQWMRGAFDEINEQEQEREEESF